MINKIQMHLKYVLHFLVSIQTFKISLYNFGYNSSKSYS